MDDKPKKRRKLPRSGLASDILGASAEIEDEPQALAPELEAPMGGDPSRSVLEFIDQVGFLADQAEEPAVEREIVKIVTFHLDKEIYGVEIEKALEVVRVDEVVEVPQSPAHVRGIMNLRGRILPVLEIKTRMGMQPVIIGPKSRIVVVEGHGRLAGVLVDAVAHVVPIPRDQIEPPPEGTTTVSSDYVVGLGKSDRGLVILIDVDRVMLVK